MCSAHSLLFIQSRIPAQGMAPLTGQVVSRKYAQRPISLVLLDFIKLPTEIKHHTVTSIARKQVSRALVSGHIVRQTEGTENLQK